MQNKHIKFIKPDIFDDEDDSAVSYIHILNPCFNGGEFTLCGVAYDGDGRGKYTEHDNKPIEHTDEKITCPKCIALIDFCKSIKAKQIRRN